MSKRLYAIKEIDKRLRRSAELETPIAIGGGQADGDTISRFAGGLDEVMVYNRALAPAEVAALARGARPPMAR